MKKNKASVAQVLEMIESGDGVDSVEVDFKEIKVEALNVVKLSKAGIKVPDAAIYYDDESIVVDDEELGGDWKRIHYDPIETEGSKSEIKLKVSTSIQNWVRTKNIGIEELVEELLTNFYNSNKLLENKK